MPASYEQPTRTCRRVGHEPFGLDAMLRDIAVNLHDRRDQPDGPPDSMKTRGFVLCALSRFVEQRAEYQGSRLIG